MLDSEEKERNLDLWREDLLLSEHHEHWHLIYPYLGAQTKQLAHDGRGRNFQHHDPGGPYLHVAKDRQGELFVYMHQQLLARYNAERLSVGLGAVEPLDDYDGTIVEEHDPNEHTVYALTDVSSGPDGLTAKYEWMTFGPRRPFMVLGDLDSDLLRERRGARMQAFKAHLSNIKSGIMSGSFVSMDKLGATIEASIASIDCNGHYNSDENFHTYGYLHNDGHLHIAMLSDSNAGPGVMISESTAIHDPVFYRWHRHIDNLCFAWQERLPPQLFPSSVSIVAKDIIVVSSNGLPNGIRLEDMTPEQGLSLGTKAFVERSNSWGSAFDGEVEVQIGAKTKIVTTDTLHTRISQRLLRTASFWQDNTDPFLEPDLADNRSTSDDSSYKVDYLTNDAFCFYIRMENPEGKECELVARVFLAPEETIEDRRSWIEMDKFKFRTSTSEKMVIFRRSIDSEVIRKPAYTERMFLEYEQSQKLKVSATGQTLKKSWNACECGLPHTLLLPRGSNEGMMFRLFVILTEGDDLDIPISCCHKSDTPLPASSYCGSLDVAYPDKRAMGFPFDRPWRKSIAETVDEYPNMTWRAIQIRHINT